MMHEDNFPRFEDDLEAELERHVKTPVFVLPRLPIHVPMSHDESAISYIMRLDELNEYSGSVIRRFTHKKQKLCIDGWVEGEYSTLAQAVEEINYHHKISKLRFCPLCIRNNGYLKAQWHLTYSVVCTIHEVALLDHCQGCHSVRDKLAGFSFHHKCGFNFAASKSEKCSAELLNLQKFILGEVFALGVVSLVGEGYQELSLLERLQVVDAFAWVGHSKQVELGDPSLESIHFSVEWTREMLAPVASAFASEEGFKSLLDFLMMRGVSNSSFDKENFQQFYNLIYNRMQHACFDRFKRILESHINTHWSKTLTRRNKHFSPQTIYAHCWLSTAEACRIFDLSRSSLMFAIKTNMITYQVAHHQTRKTYTVYRPDLLSRRDAIAERITAVEAAAILGVTKKQFQKFIKLGLFNQAIPPKTGICSHWSFSRKELQKFISDICNCPEVTSLDGQISLSKAIRMHWRHFDTGIADVVSMIRQNILQAKRCGTQTGLRQIMIDENNLSEFLSGIPTRNFMTVSELAKELKINEEFTYQLVNLGLLQCQLDTSQHARMIAHEQLDDFKEHFVLLSKLSKCLGLNSRDLMNYFAAKGIYPVDHERPKRLRQKVYLRESIRHLGLTFNCIAEGRDWRV